MNSLYLKGRRLFMTLNLTKRALVRIITFITALVIVLAALFGINYSENQNYKRTQEYTYLQSVEDLYTYLSNINSTLTKGMYCASPQMLSTLSSMLWRDAGFAKTASLCFQSSILSWETPINLFLRLEITP